MCTYMYNEKSTTQINESTERCKRGMKTKIWKIYYNKNNNNNTITK